MRLVYKKYADGDSVLYKTDDRGGNPQTIKGEIRDRSKISRVPIFIEVSCDDDEGTRHDAATALSEINQHLK